MSLYVVTGTDTGVGKTYVSTRLISSLRARGLDAIGLKPVETGWNAATSDAQLLADASSRELAETICFHFDLPAAPSIAAAAEGRSIDLASLLGWVRGWSAPFTLLEGAGGWLVPFADFLFRDLVAALNPAGVLLVSSGQLGTINHTLLSAESIRATTRLAAIIVSRPEPLSLAEIRSRLPEPVFTTDDLSPLVELLHQEHLSRL